MIRLCEERLSRKLVGVIKAAGATEVHVRIASPPVRWPCFYGMDYPTRRELIAAFATPEEIESLSRRELAALSLAGGHAFGYARHAVELLHGVFLGQAIRLPLKDPAQLAELDRA
jgi:glutamine phosphoribosylpyrophosphate amidotransferase